MKKKKPIVIRVGAYRASIYTLATGQYDIKYRNREGKLISGGRFKLLPSAKAKAHSLLTELDKEDSLRDSLSQEELEMLAVMRSSKINKKDIELLEERNKSTIMIDSREALSKWLEEDVAPHGYSRDHLFKCHRMVDLFCDRYRNDSLNEIDFHSLDKWVKTWGFGYKQHNNLLSWLKRFFAWATPRNYVVSNPVLHIKPLPNGQKDSAHEILTPDQFLTILSACPNDHIPWLSISGFAGLRGVEIYGRAGNRDSGLDWGSVDFDRRVIYVNPESAKRTVKLNGRMVGKPRIVPMCDALYSWLKPWRGSKGMVHPLSFPFNYKDKDKKPSVTSCLGDLIGGWRNNALRSSCASYRLAITKDVSLTKMEMGHSAAMLLNQYNNPQFQDTAQEWYSLTREKVLGADNIIKFG